MKIRASKFILHFGNKHLAPLVAPSKYFIILLSQFLNLVCSNELYEEQNVILYYFSQDVSVTGSVLGKPEKVYTLIAVYSQMVLVLFSSSYRCLLCLPASWFTPSAGQSCRNMLYECRCDVCRTCTKMFNWCV